jgi:hypothetical protein
MNILYAELLSQQDRLIEEKENRAGAERMGFSDIVETASNEILKSMILVDLIIEELRRQKEDIHYCLKCQKMIVRPEEDYCSFCK